MSKFAEAILKAFGVAAKDAEDDQAMNALVTTAMTALDAEPAGGADAPAAPEAGPAAREEKPREETPASDAAPTAPASGLEAKMDKLIELVTARDKEPGKPEGEKALDEMIASLDGGSAVTIPVGDAYAAGPARDAALAMLKAVRPAVASIEDAATRSRVTDALLGAVRSPDVLGGIMQAARENAQKASDAAAPASFDKLCADQKAAYDARNPHKQKEDK